MSILKQLSLYIFIIISFSKVFAQPNYNKVAVDTFYINFNNIYKLSSPVFIPFSESIRIKNYFLKNGDYVIDYKSGTFSLSKDLPYSVYDTLIVSYKELNVELQKEYTNRRLVFRTNVPGDTGRIQINRTPLTPESIFGKDLERSGSLIRGFSIGTNKDLSLNSGLRLQLSGKLSDEIEIIAALTDENSPIQPEGNTERLDELDKVFIQVKHPNAQATFGDFEVNKKLGEFGIINRKLQGLFVEGFYKDYNAFLSAASSKGKYNNNTFYGIDNVQGPYRLYGINNEREIIVIAGSEKVYIDGIEQKRGENNDYVIDYSIAQITFTTKRLITNNSRIVVDFEYTDRRFERSFLGAGASSSFFNKNLSVNLQFLQEGDNKDALIDMSFSDEDKAILSAAGDQRGNASRSGIFLAPLDSTGKRRGIYEPYEDPVSGETYYQYNPGNENSIYNLSFSYVGDFKGDYTKISFNEFSFVGKNRGNYQPIIYLPLPELRQLANVTVNGRVFEKLTASFELAGSNFDRNRYSELNDDDNQGAARNINLILEPLDVSIANSSLGKVGFSFRDRYVQDRFTSIDRYNNIEFNRDFNIYNAPVVDEYLREFFLNYNPIADLSIISGYSHLKKEGFSTSNKYTFNSNYFKQNKYKLAYSLESVKTYATTYTGYWERQKVNSFYFINENLKPGIDVLFENRKEYIPGLDSLNSTSFRFQEIRPFFEIIKLGGVNFTSTFSFREDYYPLAGNITRESNSYTQFYDLTYNGIKEVNQLINITIRKKKFSEAFKGRGNLNNETILIRSQTRIFPIKAITGDLYYEVSTQKSARLEKLFVKVEKGLGNYIYLGDLNSNSIVEENEFQLVNFDGEYLVSYFPTEQLFPVIDLKTSTRWKIFFNDFFAKDSNSIISKLLKPISTETYVRIEENSREEDIKKIYLLNFASFLNKQNTVRGSNFFQQDIFLFENDREFSLRFRYNQRKSLFQYSGSLEESFLRERSIRMKVQLADEITNQTDYVNIMDNVDAAETSNRRRKIEGNNISTDFGYRAFKNVELGFKIKVGRSWDYYPITPTKIDNNNESIRLNITFAGQGRIRLEFERNEYIANSTNSFIPYELTGGNVVGLSYLWRLNFDYKINNYLQTNASYEGRIQGARPIHNARAEIRAFF